jgi:hypothetical protein
MGTTRTAAKPAPSASRTEEAGRARQRQAREGDDPIAAAGASDAALAEVEEAEPIAEPVDGGDVEHELEFGDSTPIGEAALDEVDEWDDEDELPPPVQTRVRLRVGGRVKVVPLVHQPGCPAHAGRVESYPIKSPRGRRYVISRCVDCGEQMRTRISRPHRD